MASTRQKARLACLSCALAVASGFVCAPPASAAPNGLRITASQSKEQRLQLSHRCDGREEQRRAVATAPWRQGRRTASRGGPARMVRSTPHPSPAWNCCAELPGWGLCVRPFSDKELEVDCNRPAYVVLTHVFVDTCFRGHMFANTGIFILAPEHCWYDDTCGSATSMNQQHVAPGVPLYEPAQPCTRTAVVGVAAAPA